MGFVLLVNIRIKPESVEAFMKKVGENAREARKEPGCRQFEVLVDPKERDEGGVVRDLRRRARLRSAPGNAALQEIPGRGRAAACLA